MMKKVLLVVLTMSVVALSANAGVLFSDNFDYAVGDTTMLKDVNPDWSTSPWGNGSNDAKLVSWIPDKAYFSNSTWGDNNMKFAHTDVGAGDYSVKVDAYRYNADYRMEWYAGGRITDSSYIAAGALIGEDADGVQHVYARIIDSTGYASGDYWLAVWSPEDPISIELNIEGDQVVANFVHAGLTQQISYTTGVLNAGDAGFGGKNPWSYSLGLFDNFEVSSVPEPATIGMLGLGLLGLVRRRK